MNWAPPSPEEQVLFLRNVQRLLAEGQFTASYKFALLLALADLAVVEGDDSGAPLCLETTKISEKFVEYYWPQCRPYVIGGQQHTHILRQNTDRQATIITSVIQSQEQLGGSLFELQQKSPRVWRTLVTRVNRTVCGMPLWRLQTVGNERLDFDDNDDAATTAIILKPGVAYCFRAFYSLLRDLIQAAWVRFVQKVNANHLGNLTDLGSFLFGRERGVLVTADSSGHSSWSLLLLPQKSHTQHGSGSLRAVVPLPNGIWATTSSWLIQPATMRSPITLQPRSICSWIEQNREHADEIAERLAEAALPHDLAASVRIAEWAYEQTERAKGQVWIAKGVFRHLGPEWRQLLVA